MREGKTISGGRMAGEGFAFMNSAALPGSRTEPAGADGPYPG